jgi:hydroxymethylpyrimidine/phosphomethylpyrimidine kinase
MASVATALTIAGSDSGGGAGIQADLKTFSAFGVYGASVLTAITAQNTRAVTAVEAVSPAIVAAQVDAVLDDIRIDAIKIGMLGAPAMVEAVAGRLRGRAQPVVLDPVMVAKSGAALLEAAAVAALRDRLLPLASVVTPNLPEAARLLRCAPAADAAEMEAQGRRLLALGPAAVLIKGGHGRGAICADVLLVGDGPALVLEAPRVATRNTHGTGCSLSAAIAAGLAKGQRLPDAVRAAHAWLQGAIRAADGLGVGTGHGPVHHFHALWPRVAEAADA